MKSSQECCFHKFAFFLSQLLNYCTVQWYWSTTTCNMKHSNCKISKWNIKQTRAYKITTTLFNLMLTTTTTTNAYIYIKHYHSGSIIIIVCSIKNLQFRVGFEIILREYLQLQLFNYLCKSLSWSSKTLTISVMSVFLMSSRRTKFILVLS